MASPALSSAGWRPAFLGPVRLAGQDLSWKPSPVSAKARLDLSGPSLGYNWMDMMSRAPTSILLMTAGAGGFYISTVLPTPVDVILKAAGIGLVGYGVYHLFSEPSDAASNPSPASGEPKTTPTVSEFSLITGSWLSPQTKTKPDVGTWSNKFDASVMWANGATPKEGKSNIPAGINWDVQVTYYIYVNGFLSPQFTTIDSLGPFQLSLAAGADLAVPIRVPADAPRVNATLPYGERVNFYMMMQIRKYDNQGHAIPVGDPIFVGPFKFWG